MASATWLEKDNTLSKTTRREEEEVLGAGGCVSFGLRAEHLYIETRNTVGDYRKDNKAKTMNDYY